MLEEAGISLPLIISEPEVNSGILAQPRGCILPSQLWTLKVQVLQWDFHPSFWFSCQLFLRMLLSPGPQICPWLPAYPFLTLILIPRLCYCPSDTRWASGSNPVDPSGTTIIVPLINTSIIWDEVMIITSPLRCGPQPRLTRNCQHYYFKRSCWKHWPDQQNLGKLLSYPSLLLPISTSLFFFSYWLIHDWQEEKIGIELGGKQIFQRRVIMIL